MTGDRNESRADLLRRPPAPEESACSPLSESRLEELLDRFAECRVLVIGDSILDEYVWGHVRRISPEAPVPVFEPQSITCTTGGATNVAANIVALGGRAELVSITGDDDAAHRLRDEMWRQGVGSDGIQILPGRPTTVKSRYFSQSQQIMRVDREHREPLADEEAGPLIEAALARLPHCGAVLFSDYVKGAVTPRLAAEVRAEAARLGVPVFANPKPASIPLYRGIDMVTLNQSEAEAVCGISLDSLELIHLAGERLTASLEAAAIVVTLGGRGLLLFCRNQDPRHLPVVPLKVYDPCGCGDSAISAAALARAAGAGWVEAAALANLAGNAKVRRLGVVPVTQQEIREVWAISRAGLNGAAPAGVRDEIA